MVYGAAPATVRFRHAAPKAGFAVRALHRIRIDEAVPRQRLSLPGVDWNRTRIRPPSAAGLRAAGPEQTGGARPMPERFRVSSLRQRRAIDAFPLETG